MRSVYILNTVRHCSDGLALKLSQACGLVQWQRCSARQPSYCMSNPVSRPTETDDQPVPHRPTQSPTLSGMGLSIG